MSSVIDMIARCAERQPDTAMAPTYEEVAPVRSSEPSPCNTEYLPMEEIVVDIIA